MTKYDASKEQEVEIIKIDIEKQPVLAKRYNIRAVPTIIYLKNGKIISRDLGFKSVEDLKLDVAKYFK